MSKNPKIVEKPWGKEVIFADTEKYIGKILVIRKGESLSLQYHEKKDESIYVAKGVLELIVNTETRRLTVGMCFRILPLTRHRMTALEECEIFEVSTPHMTDVVRLEDRYGRAEQT